MTASAPLSCGNVSVLGLVESTNTHRCCNNRGRAIRRLPRPNDPHATHSDLRSLLCMTRLARRVLSVGRHELATDRRKSSAVLAAVIAPAAVFFAAGGDVRPLAAGGDADPVVEDVASCCMEIVATAPIAFSSAPSGGQSSVISAPGQVSPSRWRVVEREIPRLLPVGLAPE